MDCNILFKLGLELDTKLDRVNSLIGLLSFLQDVCSASERARLANAEGYIVEVLIRESASIRKIFDQIWDIQAQNQFWHD